MEEYLEYVGGTAGAVAIAGIAASAAWYFSSGPTPVPFPVDHEDQSYKMDAEGPEMIRVSRFYKEAKEGRFLTYIYEDAKTLYDVFRRGAHVSNNGPALGWRDGYDKPFQWLNYNEALLRAQNFGAGLVSLGLKPGPDTFVGIYSQNCPEWILTEQGLYSYSMVIVPLYDTLGPDACHYIINQTEISTVICDTEGKLVSLINNAPPCLKQLISLRDVSEATRKAAQEKKILILKFEEVEDIGCKSTVKEVPPNPEDLCTVCYTSGTTGNPKGVMLTHQNVVADVSAVMIQLGEQRPQRDDIMLSFLPLAHMLERCCEVAMYMEGGAVGFYRGDIRHLADDMKALKPSVTPVVPRLLNRIYDKAYSAVEGSSVKKYLMNLALRKKKAEIEKGILRRNSIWDKLVFRKIQEGMGGRVRLVVVGSAPLAGNVLTFMRCALGCHIVEGYGQTECCAPCTLTVNGEFLPDHVGPPIACNAIKLVDVPDMDYFASVGQGEVCLKGTNLFKGYFKDPQRTSEAIDKDGWLHTGDIGSWTNNGTLKIIDRKKHIFKLAQGEYVAPEKIENIYIRSSFVGQIFVHGESLKSCIVGIIVPDVEIVKKWANDMGIPGTLSVLCANKEVKKTILDDITVLGKDAGLKSFEQVKDVYLHPDPFSVQNGLLTPTLKSKRPELKKYFKPQIEDMYSKLV